MIKIVLYRMQGIDDLISYYITLWALVLFKDKTLAPHT